MKSIRLKSQRPARVLSGHPWAFSGEIDPCHQTLENGDGVELLDDCNRPLGCGLWSNTSQISWRKYSREKREFDYAYISGALAGAIARRPESTFRRLVWSEADFLPGLVIDQFADIFVVQALTAGADRALPEVTFWLKKNFNPREIILRNDAPNRQHDGLPLEVKTATGAILKPEWFRIEGVEYFLDLTGGQKNGFYLDQREQHLNIAKFAKDRRVLDAFCNQGGFALHAAKNGAKSVLGIDSSENAIDAATRNAEKNGLRCHFHRENMFDWFTANRDEKFDLIILDPPPFARNKGALDGAFRGYKELNLRALRLLNPGGILATYSCSQRVSIAEFLALIGDAADDAHRDAHILEITGQPADHPVLLNFPESHYLKGVILQVK